MDIFNVFKLKIIDIIKKLPLKIDEKVDLSLIQVTAPKEEKFGDLSTNAALVLSKILCINTLELAQSIADKLLVVEKSSIADIDIIKPGFINISLNNNYWYQVLDAALNNADKFGWEDIGKQQKINIEYVSANPTGPMHIGHGRGAVIGDVLANLYSFFGYSVTKEYYVNDAGNQIKGLALSVYYRYCEKLGKDVEKPQDFYPGDYIIETATKLIDKEGNKWLNREITEIILYFGSFAINYMMELIREDLVLLGIKHDIFSSEKEVSNDNVYNTLKQELLDKKLLYMGVLEPPKGTKAKVVEEDKIPSLLFRTSKFGDDSDRVVEKRDGSKTYFANDILYHDNKIKRGFNLMIDLLGVDHKGYQKRLQAAVKALSGGKSNLEVVFTELVNLLKDGAQVKMSKRAGTFITLREVLEEVPKDAFRIMMLSRSNTSALDFDLATISEKSEKNPVYYLQYAYARINSVFNKAKEIFTDLNEDEILASDKTLLKHEKELLVIKALASYPKLLKSALTNNNVHLIFVLLLNITKSIHALWSAGKTNVNLRFIVESNKNLTLSRLSLLLASKKIMFTLFHIIGIDEPKQM